MVVDFLRKLFLCVVFCLVQVLVLNHIHLFGFATPLLYTYFVLMFRRGYPRWGILLWSFTLGVMLDTFSNTPGIASASLTLLGALQPYFLAPFIPRDSVPDMLPSMRTLGFLPFCYYTAILAFFYSLVFFSLEMFSFFNWKYWMECVFGSMVLTMALILAIDNVRSGR